ncbi:MAG: hypothetical protein DRI71_05645 [Bacteroidetes bacterium]|nr:MAG: hypothetical protein DRI71_05645 [Bacteroidota bacterium]
MKNLTFIISLAALTLLLACGGSSTSTEEKATTVSDQESTANIYSNDGLSIELNSDWEGKKGPQNHSLWGYAMESSGDIYADLNDPYSEDLDELEEVKVDGLPALTVKRKFMANESKIARKWFIYNGIDVYEFSVEAPEADFDDNLAKGLINDVKIANRTKNVALPTVKKGKFEKPTSFPSEKVQELADLFAKEAVISEELLNNTSKLLSTINALSESNPNIQIEGENVKIEVLDSLAQNSGLEDWHQAEKVISATYLSLAVVATLKELQDANEENALALDIAKSLISQGGMSIEDLNYTYENWDKVVDFVNLLEKNK